MAAAGKVGTAKLPTFHPFGGDPEREAACGAYGLMHTGLLFFGTGRLRAVIRADLAARGATPENPEGYCTVGREEIAKGSVAGNLLRAK